MEFPWLRVRVLADTDVGHRKKKEPETTVDVEVVVGDEVEDDNYEKISEGRHTNTLSEDDGIGHDLLALAEIPHPQSRHVSAIQEAQLSPDGTCVFTTDNNRMFSVYPIDVDILKERSTRSLNPHATFRSADPFWAFSVNPYFDLNDASSTTVLVSRRDHFITLHNALWDVSQTQSIQVEDEPENDPIPINISTRLASYKLIDHLREIVIAPSSLTYTHSGTHFFAGEQDRIALFDMEYTDDPISKIRTIPAKRNKLKGGGYGFKGVITALSISASSSLSRNGVLAAGSRTRYVGLYDAEGSGDEITHFSLPGRKTDGDKDDLSGAGVSHVKWSVCGKYLFVAERMSNAILIYDIRKFERALGHCAGRKALTNKSMGFDIWSAGDAYSEGASEVWAGGTDGCVRVWKDPQLKEGAIEAHEVVRVEDGDVPVSSAMVHPSGSLAVAATSFREVYTAEKEAQVGDGKGTWRGGGHTPRYREWGGLKILGLGNS